MIKLNNVHFSYGSKSVLSAFNLHFEKGGIYGLLGKNGTGKSTLLKLIAGLLFPDQGTINVMGLIPKKRQPQFLSDIYLIPEEFNLPDVKIDALLKYYAPFYPKFDIQKFSQYIKEFEVPENNSFSQMSLGQKKKAIISFGLACNTSILLMDEPTNGLDIISKSQFKDVMKHTHDPNRCMIVSTHQAKDLESLINRVAIIDEQGILLNMDIDTILSKLHFKISDDSAELLRALFIEEYMNEAKSVIMASEGAAINNKFDLELLFKAVVMDKSFVQKNLLLN